MGLVHRGSATFSASTSVILNDVFTTRYRYYLMVVRGYHSTGASNLSLRLRSGGVNDSGTNYDRQNTNVDGSSWNATRVTNSNLWSPAVFDVNTQGFELWIGNPATTDRTTFVSAGFDMRSGTSPLISMRGGSHDLASAYDGFELFPPTGTFTGSLSVYALSAG